MMRFYNHLYVGKKAKRRRFEMIQNLRSGKFQPGVHVITPPINGNNILDIYPAFMLMMPHYQDQDFFIIGIAADYWEAMEVVRTIVDEMYRQTGAFSVNEFLMIEE